MAQFERVGFNVEYYVRNLVEFRSRRRLLFPQYKKKKRAIFLGTEDREPKDVKKMVIDTVYVDFASKAFGIKVL